LVLNDLSYRHLLKIYTPNDRKGILISDDDDDDDDDETRMVLMIMIEHEITTKI
jgi:hypothetical protein